MRAVNIRARLTPGIAVLLLVACSANDEPSSDPLTPTPTPSPVEAATSEATTSADPKAWCEQWWEQVVEADNENAAVGAVFLLVQDGINVDDELISSRSEILDYRTGSATADEIEQAIGDINLACSVYIALDD